MVGDWASELKNQFSVAPVLYCILLYCTYRLFASWQVQASYSAQIQLQILAQTSSCLISQWGWLFLVLVPINPPSPPHCCGEGTGNDRSCLDSILTPPPVWRMSVPSFRSGGWPGNSFPDSQYCPRPVASGDILSQGKDFPVPPSLHEGTVTIFTLLVMDCFKWLLRGHHWILYLGT